MSLFSEGGGTYPDILIILLLLLLLLTSSLLNVLVLLYNMSSPVSIPKFLFSVLAVSDFLSGLIISLNSVLRIARPEESKCGDLVWVGNEYFCSVDLDPSGLERMLGALHYTLFTAPSCFTAVLAICRYLQIQFPFTPLKRRYIVVFILTYLMYVLVVLFVIMFHEKAMYFSQLQTTNNVYFVGADFSEGATFALFSWPCLAAQIISLVVSVFTITSLYKTLGHSAARVSRDNGRRSSIKILIQNTGGIAMSLCMLYYYFHAPDEETGSAGHGGSKEMMVIYFSFAFTVFLPTFLSTFNPVIFILFTPKVSRFFSKGHKKRNAVCPVSQSGNEMFHVLNIHNNIGEPVCRDMGAEGNNQRSVIINSSAV